MSYLSLFIFINRAPRSSRDTVSPTSPNDRGRISSVISDPKMAFTPIGHYQEMGMGGPGECAVLLSQSDMSL